MAQKRELVEDRFYIRVSFNTDAADHEWVRALLTKRLGKVFDHGVGTEIDACSGWFEIRPRKSVLEQGVAAVLAKHLPGRVRAAFPILRGEGKAQARQMQLWSSTIGVIE